jgi:hypothetical protein
MKLIKRGMSLYFLHSMNFQLAIRSAVAGIFKNKIGPPKGLLTMGFH